MPAEDRLGSNSSNGKHGQPSIQQFIELQLLHLLSIGIVLRSGEAKVSGSTLPLHRGLDCRNGNDGIPQTDPQQQLMHGSLQQDVVGVDRLGNGGKGVGISGNANKIGDDEAHDGEHGSAAVAEFGLAKEGYEGGVGLGQVEWVELEFASLEVGTSNAVVL